MTTTDLQAAYKKAQERLRAFKTIVWRNYERAAHLDALDRALQQVTAYIESGGTRGIGRLIIEMPPRHGKTLTTSRLYPAWHLGRNPDDRVMLVSYGATLAYKNSQAARNIIRTPQYQGVFPHVALAQDSKAKDSWNLTDPYKGGCDAMGIGGGATGKGAHLLIIDDPVKSRAEAESETYRTRNWDAFTADLYSRLEPGGAIIIMATRWHMDDLTGRALQMDEGWKRLRLPALAEDDDALGRAPGAALWPDRYDVDRMHEIRTAIGEYDWSSLYQQSPMPSKAGLFDTSCIEIISHAPECKDIVRFYDLAVTAKKHSDYTAGVKLGITNDETLIVLDVYRVQKNPTQVEADIAQNAQIDGKSCRIRLEAEKAGIIQLDYLLRRKDLRGYRIDAKAPKGDKYTRAQPVASRVNTGRLKLVRGGWNRAFIDELAVFPMGAHDDQVDALSGAYDMLSNSYTTLEWSFA